MCSRGLSLCCAKGHWGGDRDSPRSATPQPSRSQLGAWQGRGVPAASPGRGHLWGAAPTRSLQPPHPRPGTPYPFLIKAENKHGDCGGVFGASSSPWGPGWDHCVPPGGSGPCFSRGLAQGEQRCRPSRSCARGTLGTLRSPRGLSPPRLGATPPALLLPAPCRGAEGAGLVPVLAARGPLCSSVSLCPRAGAQSQLCARCRGAQRHLCERSTQGARCPCTLSRFVVLAHHRDPFLSLFGAPPALSPAPPACG